MTDASNPIGAPAPIPGEMAARAIVRAEAIAAGITDEAKQNQWVRDRWWGRWLTVSARPRLQVKPRSIEIDALLRIMASHYWSGGEERSRAEGLIALAHKLGVKRQFARALGEAYPDDFITRKAPT